MEEIEKQALTKAYKKIRDTGKELNLDRDKHLFSDEEMKAIVKMSKDKTLKSKFTEIHKELTK